MVLGGLQPVLIWWALFAAGVLRWPARASTGRLGA